MKYVLNIPFEEKEDFKIYDVKYNSAEKAYIYEGESLPDILIPYRCKIFTLEWHIENRLNNIKPNFKNKAIWKPKKHQSYASDTIKNSFYDGAPGFLLADDTGLGKTISTINFFINEKKLKSILIVSPLAVIAHWRNSLLNMGVSDTKHITLINYDRLSKLFQSNNSKKLSSSRGKGKQKRIAREVPAPSYDLIIWDESHKAKNTESAKFLLQEKLNAKSKFKVWLSATAGQTPSELAYLRSLIGYSLGMKFSQPKSYLEWCKTFKDMMTKLNKNINDSLFNSKTPFALRRRPEDIEGWKEMERNLFPIELNETALRDYLKSWNEFKAELIEEKKVSAKQKQKKENILVKSIRFRQKSSWLRIDSTVNTIIEHLDSNKQVAISVAFKETQYKIQEILKNKKIDSAIINGDLSPDEKEKERIRFQKGECRVIIFTVEEGISLHQGEYNDVERVLLIHDMRWSAIQMAQIEGRCHRDGYFAPCYWLYAEDTKDIEIGNALVKRIKNMKILMGDDTGLLDEIESIFLKE